MLDTNGQVSQNFQTVRASPDGRAAVQPELQLRAYRELVAVAPGLLRRGQSEPGDRVGQAPKPVAVRPGCSARAAAASVGGSHLQPPKIRQSHRQRYDQLWVRLLRTQGCDRRLQNLRQPPPELRIRAVRLLHNHGTGRSPASEWWRVRGTGAYEPEGAGCIAGWQRQRHPHPRGPRYAWNGVDTNFVLRARGGLRISGGTSTGRAVRDTCFTDVDTPSVKGRVGHEYAVRPE